MRDYVQSRGHDLQMNFGVHGVVQSLFNPCPPPGALSGTAERRCRGSESAGTASRSYPGVRLGFPGTNGCMTRLIAAA